MRTVSIIGSGFAGLSAACYCAKAGYTVHIFEKNDTIGGRARQMISENGYVFDMGPSWYWMPDIFDRFFADFGYNTSDFYNLTRLDPQFAIRFSDDLVEIPDTYEQLLDVIEILEAGAGGQLKQFLKDAQLKYELAMADFIDKPCHSWTEFASVKMIKPALQLQLFTSFSSHVEKYFKSDKVRQLMKFPILFLGADPKDIPAMYSLMNYAGLQLGTWYPQGGFGSVVKAMGMIAEQLGVKVHVNSEVRQINIENHKVCSLTVGEKDFKTDAVIGAADYHHIEQQLLDQSFRNYKEDYWRSKTFAPSALIYYVGLKRKLRNIRHHTLFFENDFTVHSQEIYSSKVWPSAPLFYVCCPSVTDPTVAPAGHENLFFLMPIATGIEDYNEKRELYFADMIRRFEKHIGETGIQDAADYKKSYCVSDFVNDYHAYQGNAYGLANTLNQTAILKPAIRNKKLPNLFYAGQLTVPGPGVPPSLISGRIAANEVLKYLKD